MGMAAFLFNSTGPALAPTCGALCYPRASWKTKTCTRSPCRHLSTWPPVPSGKLGLARPRGQHIRKALDIVTTAPTDL